MSISREQRIEAARRKFKKLAADDSPVRLLSEATRENDAEEYNRITTMNAFEQGLAQSIARLGEIAEHFKNKPKKHN